MSVVNHERVPQRRTDDRQCERQIPDDVMTPEEEIKDPFFFEFLDLKDEYSEHELESA